MASDDPWLEATAQIRAELDDELREEAREVFVAEAARTRMIDRRGVARLLLRCGETLDGDLVPAGAEHVDGHLTVLTSADREVLVAESSIVSVTGSEPALRLESSARPRTLASWLREAWDLGVPVSGLTCRGVWVRGSIVRVGADHVDIGPVGDVVTVPFTAIEAWSRSAG
jgi:hypothetical protein